MKFDKCEYKCLFETFSAISKGDYRLIGKMISICLIHGGVAPHFFAPRLFSLVVGEATEDVNLTEILDEGFRSELQKARVFVNADAKSWLIQCFCHSRS